MIADLRSGEAPAELTGDVCVVGSGPAGVTLALELAKKGRQVVLLESGGEHYEEASQALYEGRITGHQNIDVAASRLRQFGGTSGHWTGMCAPLDPVDFTPRPDMPDHGWPIRRADLDPFYARAQPYLDLGPYRYDFDYWRPNAPGPALPLDPTKVFTTVYQQSPPTRFALKYMETVRAEPKISCWLHANLVDIALDAAGSAVERIEARSLDGHSVSVRANRFVIACGGVENARILLNCRKQRAEGLGNENGLVGRYYTDHMTIETTLVALEDEVDATLYEEQHTIGDTVLNFGLKIAPDEIVARGLNNNAAFLIPQFEDETFNDEFRDYGWIAFSEMVKAFAHGRVPERFGERYCEVVDDLGRVTTGAYRHVMRKVKPRSKPVAFKLRQDAEQSPNPDSRVTLIDEVDPLGFQRVALDWRVTDEDLLRLRRTHQFIGEQLGAAGLGRMRLGISEPPDHDIAFSGYHHMGTTRMHADPKRGVVDANCRLHSVGNLYMAGSSVFTTAGCANPTLTITALAIRLAEHLSATLA
ncbi:FAD-dependent oxidoreductase [Methylopila henanensis]|uniref:FAD-dependent oxidoreductase n=1 Tax=Methylopila henanensis TaxID=873516 RepID=A0ABW4K1I7_9HYPH